MLTTSERLEVRFSQAGPEGLATVLSILTESAEWARAKGVEGLWQVPYPAEWVSPSLERGEVYLVYVGSQPIATVTFRWSDPAFWGEVAADAGYLHRLAVRRAFAGRQVGHRIVEWAANKVRAEGRSFLRLDCRSNHAGLRRYYLSLGFRPVRDTVVPGGIEVVLLERPV